MKKTSPIWAKVILKEIGFKVLISIKGGGVMKKASINHIEIWQNERLISVAINDEINISGTSQMHILIKDGKINIDLLVEEPVNEPAI